MFNIFIISRCRSPQIVQLERTTFCVLLRNSQKCAISFISQLSLHIVICPKKVWTCRPKCPHVHLMFSMSITLGSIYNFPPITIIYGLVIFVDSELVSPKIVERSSHLKSVVRVGIGQCAGITPLLKWVMIVIQYLIPLECISITFDGFIVLPVWSL